jgi:hypothetical protein
MRGAIYGSRFSTETYCNVLLMLLLSLVAKVSKRGSQQSARRRSSPVRRPGEDGGHSRRRFYSGAASLPLRAWLKVPTQCLCAAALTVREARSTSRWLAYRFSSLTWRRSPLTLIFLMSTKRTSCSDVRHHCHEVERRFRGGLFLVAAIKRKITLSGRVSCLITASRKHRSDEERARSDPELGRVDKPDPDSNAGQQHERGKALDELVVSGGDAA